MKKASLLIILILLFNSVADAQRLRDESLWIKYVNLPQIKLPDDHLTYSVYLSGQTMTRAGYANQGAAKSITMDGFKRVNDTGTKGGHLQLRINTGNINYDQPEFKSKTTKSKTKDGKEITTTTYYYVFSFEAIGDFSITNPEGDRLEERGLSYSRTYESAALQDADYVRKQRNSYFNEFQRKFAGDALTDMKRTASVVLTSKYDYQNERKRYELYVIKKHASEDQWEKHYNNVKYVFETADFTTSSEDLLQGLQKSIDYYEMQASKNPRNNKKLKRIYEAANYNLALIYTFTDQFEKALEYANRVLDSEGKDAKTRRLMDFVKSQNDRMVELDIHTLHYRRTLENAMAPDRVEAMEEEMEEIAEHSNTSEAIVYLEYEELAGTISWDKDATDLVFGEGGNIKFIIEEEGRIEELELCSDEVTGFIIGDRTFMKMNFAPSAKGKEEISVQILEEAYTSDKINVYKYYPCSGALSADKPEIALKRANEGMPLSLESTQFLIWKKGIAEYFGDCPDLRALCESGEIKKDLDDMIKAARIYAEICE